MKANDIMTRNVVCIGAGHGVRHAARIMLENGVSGLPVIDDGGELIGILTEGDLIRRIQLHKSFDIGDRKIGQNEIDEAVSDYVRRISWRVVDCMSSPVATVSEAESVSIIAALMSEKTIKRLPVMKDNKITGIVSRCDLLSCFATGSCETAVAGDVNVRRAVLARILNDLGYPRNAVSVDVSNGQATVSGSVGSAAEERAIIVAAESVPGVGSVTSKLAVQEDGRGTDARPADP